MGVQNETLTFEDGMRLTKYKCVKEYEDDTDETFEELCCPEAGKPEMRRDVLSAIAVLAHLQRHGHLPCSIVLRPSPVLLLCAVSLGSCPQPTAPTFLIICWKPPLTSSTSLADSAFVQLNFRALPSQ